MMTTPFTRVLSELKKETVRQLFALLSRWMGGEEDMERLLLSMLNNKDLRKGLSAMILELAVRKMRPSTLVFSAMCEARLGHHDPDRGEGYRDRPPKEHLGQLRKKVEALGAALDNGESKQRVAVLCIDIANYAQFVALTRGELNDFLAEDKDEPDLTKILEKLEKLERRVEKKSA